MSGETPMCFSCVQNPWPAEFIATAPHKDGGGKIAFGAPLCDIHVPLAMVVGWNPIYRLDSPEGQRLWAEHGFCNPHKPASPTQQDRREA